MVKIKNDFQKKSIFNFFITFPIIDLYIVALPLNLFEDNKFYYKNGYQRVQLHSENDNVRNIHPVKIDPLRIEGALKLNINKIWSKS